MVIARVSKIGFTVLASEKEVVRLGEGAEGMDHLTFPAIERGVNALRRMKQLADAHSAVISAVATSAVREASNKEEFLTAVRESVALSHICRKCPKVRKVDLKVSDGPFLSSRKLSPFGHISIPKVCVRHTFRPGRCVSTHTFVKSVFV